MPSNRSDARRADTVARQRTRAENHAELVAGISNPSPLTTGEGPPRLHRMIREADLYGIVGLKKTAVAAMVERGEFPKPIKLSDGGRAKAWIEAEIIAWQLKRLAMREVA